VNDNDVRIMQTAGNRASPVRHFFKKSATLKSVQGRTRVESYKVK